MADDWMKGRALAIARNALGDGGSFASDLADRIMGLVRAALAAETAEAECVMEMLNDDPVHWTEARERARNYLARRATPPNDGVIMISEAASPIIDRLMEIGCIVKPMGSRVTCSPPPLDTDEDYLVFCHSETEVAEVVDELWSRNFKWEGSEHYQDMAANNFMSWRNADNVNLIVTANAGFRDRHLVATELCRRLNLMDKADRVAVFQAVLYGTLPKVGQ